MNANRIAFAALVVSVIALGLSSVAVQRAMVASQERVQPAGDMSGTTRNVSTDTRISTRSDGSSGFTNSNTNSDTSSDTRKELLAGSEAYETTSIGEYVDVDDITVRYEVSDEVVSLGPSLDPDVP